MSARCNTNADLNAIHTTPSTQMQYHIVVIVHRCGAETDLPAFTTRAEALRYRATLFPESEGWRLSHEVDGADGHADDISNADRRHLGMRVAVVARHIYAACEEAVADLADNPAVVGAGARK